jgi:hypothetical protein
VHSEELPTTNCIISIVITTIIVVIAIIIITTIPKHKFELYEFSRSILAQLLLAPDVLAQNCLAQGCGRHRRVCRAAPMGAQVHGGLRRLSEDLIKRPPGVI